MSKVRLIDANVLMDTFETKKEKAHDKSIKHLYGQNKNDKLYRKDCETESRCEYVLSVLRTAPTVDAVPVRCKDCKHRFTEDCPLRFDYAPFNDDWFCAGGKPKGVIED